MLGLLAEGPKHGYEIKKTMEDVLSTFTNVDSRSIYYPLRRLEKKGLVTKKLGRKGKRPEKLTYHITPQGKISFENLLSSNFLTFQRPTFNIDLSLYFLPLVDSTVARRRLRSRLLGMKKILIWLQERKSELDRAAKETTYHLRAIIEHNIELTRADIKFTQKLIKSLKSPN